jgi:lambda family phage minor tail protein L
MAYAAWQATTSYAVNAVVRATTQPGTGLVFKCITAGTSGSTEPTWPTVIYTTETTGSTTTAKVGFVDDGTVRWAAVMAVAEDLQAIAPSAIIELFELQLVSDLHGSNDLYRFHAGVNAELTYNDLVWNGNTYLRFPVQVEGFEWNGQGQLPRPKLAVSNLNSTITAILLLVNQTTPGNDLLGAKLTRIRTLAKYLDNVNFEGGVNPSGAVDATAEFPRDIYYIARKTTETRDVVEFECAAAFDLQNLKAPRRLCINNVCQWQYRSAIGCGYDSTEIGPFWTAADAPASSLSADVCGKRLDSCILRFGQVSVTGTVTSGSNILGSLTADELNRIRIGDPITGHGLPTNTTVTAKATNQLTLSANATASTSITVNGTLTGTGLTMTVTSATGLSAGMSVTGTWVPSGTTIQSISGTTITLSISNNPNYLDSATSKSVTYRFFNRLSTSNTSGVAVGDRVQGSGVYSGTAVTAISTNSFILINKSLNKDYNSTLTATFYKPRVFTQQSYTFVSNDRYVIRADASLPFGSFPGVGTIKT